MRIAFVSDNAYPWFNGGIERRRFIIMHRLASQGDEVHCFTLFRDGMASRDFTYDGIQYHCVGNAVGYEGMYTGGGKRRSAKMPLVFSFLLFFKILRYRFDLIDADSFPFLHIIPLYLHTRLRGERLVVTWHEVWSRAFWRSYGSDVVGNIGYFVEKLCAGLADMNIANASTTKTLMVGEFGTDPGRIVVFPAAIDKKEIVDFTAKNACSKEDKFAVVSRLVRHKRVGLAISAMKDLDAKLVVVGTGPELEGLKELAERQAKGKVIFKSAIGNDELSKEICTSKALLMTSEREGLSLVTLEALALGTPVVIADTSSLPSEIRGYCMSRRRRT